MTRKPRDYKAEYSARIARGKARGWSRQQARGHPRVSSVSKADKKLEKAMLEVSQGKSVKEASKRHHVAQERLTATMRTITPEGPKRGRKWAETIAGHKHVRMTIFENGKTVQVELKNNSDASTVGRYLNAVRRAVEQDNPTYLYDFRDTVIEDKDGTFHKLDTNLKRLQGISHIGDTIIYAPSFA